MLSWLKRVIRKKPKIQVPKKASSVTKVIKQKRQRNKDADYAVKTIGEYVQKKGGKKAKEFAADMGVTATGKAVKKTKRVTIPKVIEYNGSNYVKYASYESDLESAREAAADMRDLGYITKVAKFMRGSWPVYVVYRYKKDITSTEITAKKTTRKRTTRKRGS